MLGRFLVGFVSCFSLVGLVGDVDLSVPRLSVLLFFRAVFVRFLRCLFGVLCAFLCFVLADCAVCGFGVVSLVCFVVCARCAVFSSCCVVRLLV